MAQALCRCRAMAPSACQGWHGSCGLAWQLWHHPGSYGRTGSTHQRSR